MPGSLVYVTLYSRGIHAILNFCKSQNYPKLYRPTTLSHIALVSMLAPRREARRNDPLNFLTFNQYILSERERLNIPIQTISLSGRRRQTMAQHHRYLCTNFVRDIRPLRPLPEGKRLKSFGFKWRGKKCHRINMGVKHDLQQAKFRK